MSSMVLTLLGSVVEIVVLNATNGCLSCSFERESFNITDCSMIFSSSRIFPGILLKLLKIEPGTCRLNRIYFLVMHGVRVNTDNINSYFYKVSIEPVDYGHQLEKFAANFCQDVDPKKATVMAAENCCVYNGCV